MEDNGFTIAKACFLTKAMPAVVAVFLCPPPQAPAIQGGEAGTGKTKAKLENRSFTMMRPCFLPTFIDFVTQSTEMRPQGDPKAPKLHPRPPS